MGYILAQVKGRSVAHGPLKPFPNDSVCLLTKGRHFLYNPTSGAHGAWQQHSQVFLPEHGRPSCQASDDDLVAA
jgi:hypothetical protein